MGEIAVRAWAGDPGDPETETAASAGSGRWSGCRTSADVRDAGVPGLHLGPQHVQPLGGRGADGLDRQPVLPRRPGRLHGQGRALTFEEGPTADVTLQWATYFDAADQAGQSRLWGGIHISADDLTGREVGSEVGIEAWNAARRYYDGTAGS